jgi:hypothetical protein
MVSGFRCQYRMYGFSSLKPEPDTYLKPDIKRHVLIRFQVSRTFVPPHLWVT